MYQALFHASLAFKKSVFSNHFRTLSVMATEVQINASNGTTIQEAQRTFQVVVAATREWGIGKGGKLPWKLPSDLKFFKKITATTTDPSKKNAVVMGRKTWESIPDQFRPLSGRLNVVLTRSGSFDIATAENVLICGSMASALDLLASSPYCVSTEKVFVIGGGEVLREALNANGCDAIHITDIETSIDCDTFIPPIDCTCFQPWYSSSPLVENDIRYSFTTYVRVQYSEHGDMANSNSQKDKFEKDKFSFLPKLVLEKHEEYMYLRLIEDIIVNGARKNDRTGTGTFSKFGCQMRFNLRRSFPLLTTKGYWGTHSHILHSSPTQNKRNITRVLSHKTCGLSFSKINVECMLAKRKNERKNASADFFFWVISSRGQRQRVLKQVFDFARALQERGIHIWDVNASREYLDSIGLSNMEEGDLGPVYGFQWRHFGAKYTDMHADYSGKGFDQLFDVIEKIKNNPDDRRIIMSALPPYHMFAQFYVANGELSCQMYQRAADMGLGVPFNIASYSLLTCMIAQICDLVPGEFIHVLGDAHVFSTHVIPLQEQLQRQPRPFPILKINPDKKDIDSFEASDFQLIGYDPHPKIQMKMAI